MKKGIVLIITILCVMLSSSAFAYRWVESEGLWYVYDDATNEYLKNSLLDVGDGVYYLKDDGAMVTGWWRNDETGAYYFFSNKDDKDYGGMVFGLHMIDGYFHYFNDNGTLATSDEEGSYKKVYADFWADSDGYLYYSNQILHDTTTAKSEFYTNAIYYKEEALNNEFLALRDTSFKKFKVEKVEKSDNSSSWTKQEATARARQNKGKATSGGTNYWVDEQGKIHVMEQAEEMTAAEKYGPMNINK